LIAPLKINLTPPPPLYPHYDIFGVNFIFS
jgi:hypothetical protein